MAVIYPFISIMPWSVVCIICSIFIVLCFVSLFTATTTLQDTDSFGSMMDAEERKLIRKLEITPSTDSDNIKKLHHQLAILHAVKSISDDKAYAISRISSIISVVNSIICIFVFQHLLSISTFIPCKSDQDAVTPLISQLNTKKKSLRTATTEQQDGISKEIKDLDKQLTKAKAETVSVWDIKTFAVLAVLTNASLMTWMAFQAYGIRNWKKKVVSTNGTSFEVRYSDVPFLSLVLKHLFLGGGMLLVFTFACFMVAKDITRPKAYCFGSIKSGNGRTITSVVVGERE